MARAMCQAHMDVKGVLHDIINLSPLSKKWVPRKSSEHLLRRCRSSELMSGYKSLQVLKRLLMTDASLQMDEPMQVQKGAAGSQIQRGEIALSACPCQTNERLMSGAQESVLSL